MRKLRVNFWKFPEQEIAAGLNFAVVECPLFLVARAFPRDIRDGGLLEPQPSHDHVSERLEVDRSIRDDLIGAALADSREEVCRRGAGSGEAWFESSDVLRQYRPGTYAVQRTVDPAA